MRILMATGGSSHSEAALRFGAQIARHARETPTVLTVVEHDADSKAASRVLERTRALLAPILPNVQTKMRVGYPAEEIIREAEEGDYDLLVVGKRQRHGVVTRFLLGSTAERVVEHAPCPVIVAKGKTDRIRRILLCESGAVSPTVLPRFTAQLAGLLEDEEEVTLLHVMSQMSAGPGIDGKQLRAEAEELIEEHTPEGELLERDLEILKAEQVQPRPKVRHGLVVEEILAEARSGDYDLIVIGAHRGEGWRRILLDDIAHQVVAQADRPVLVVR